MLGQLKLLNGSHPLITLLLIAQIVCLLIILIVSFERFYRFRRAKIELRSFLQGIVNVLRNNKMIEAISICDKFACPVSEVVRAMILSKEKRKEEIRKIANDVGDVELCQLEIGLRLLSSLVYIGSLLGFLGVLLALHLSFSDISGEVKRLPFEVIIPYLEMACLMATAGMMLTILAYSSYQYFLSKLDALRLDMEKAAIEMSNFLSENDISEKTE